MCAACAASDAAVAPPPLDFRLPEAPAYLSPVSVAPLHEGQDSHEALAQCTGERSEANWRLGASRVWYAGVRSGAEGGLTK